MCSCNFLLRSSGNTSSRWRIPIREDDLVKKQLCSVDFEVNLRACATSFSERADIVKTAMFCRFWGVSACACNFLLRNSGSSENSCVLTILRCIYMLVQLSSQKQQTYEFSRENPYPRGWSSEKQLCSDDFEVYLHARATFFSETADLRVLEGESLSEKMI